MLCAIVKIYNEKPKYSELISIDNRNDFKKNKIVLTTNILGQEVDQNYRALIITYYSEGSFIKL